MTKTFKVAATLVFIGLISGCTIPIADPDNPTRGSFGNERASVLEADDDVPATNSNGRCPGTSGAYTHCTTKTCCNCRSYASNPAS